MISDGFTVRGRFIEIETPPFPEARYFFGSPEDGTVPRLSVEIPASRPR